MKVGDLVMAVRDGGHDANGFPRERPIAGRYYRITGIYTMSYGLGCTLAGMEPFPYKGYFLMRIIRTRRDAYAERWYFESVKRADNEFTRALREAIGWRKHNDAD